MIIISAHAVGPVDSVTLFPYIISNLPLFSEVDNKNVTVFNPVKETSCLTARRGVVCLYQYHVS
jgi:hypothetical protein